MTILRVVVGVGLAVVLVRFTLHSSGADFWGAMRHARPWPLAAGFLVYGVALALTMYRWGLLLRVQGIHLPAWDLIRLTMIGAFFNMAIPGAVGGDLVKMAYITRQLKEKRMEAVLTIVVDRLVGALGLLLIASITELLCLPFLLELGQDNRALQLAALTVGTGSLLGIACVLAIDSRQRFLRVGAIRRVAEWAERKLPVKVIEGLRRTSAALDLYRQYRTTILAALGLSMLVHSSLAIILFLAGRGLGEGHVTVRFYFLAAQVANAVAALPVTPAGVGARDAVVVLFLRAMDATPATVQGAIPVVLTLIMLTWNLIGSLFFVFSREARPSPATPGAPAAGG